MARRRAGAKSRARIGGWSAAVLVTVALAATLLGSGRMGYAVESSDGKAWLWSRTAGEAAQVDPDDGRVDRRRAVPGARGHRVQVTQSDQHLIIHDLDTGRVSSLDLSGLGLSGRLDVGLRGDPHLVLGATAAAVVERSAGTVRALDPATLRPMGPVLQLPGPVVGGEFDDAGRLWVAVPAQGTVAALKVSAQGVAVVRTVEAAEPGDDLALSVLDQGALVVDRSRRDLVTVTGGGTHRVAAPVPLAGAMVPARTHGPLAAITVPAAGSVVTLGDVAGSGRVGSFPLHDPVQDPAVPFAGKVYVPLPETGQVRVYDRAGRQTGVLTVPAGRGDLELQVREGELFVNEPGSPDAQVIGDDGRARAISKYPDRSGRGGDLPVAPVTPVGDGDGPPPVPAPPAEPVFPDPPGSPPSHPSWPEPAKPPASGPPRTEPAPPRTPSGPKPGEPATPTLPDPSTPSDPSAPTTPPDPATGKTPVSKPSSPPPVKSTPKPPSEPKPKPKPPPARNPYTPQQVCNSGPGSGYVVQRSVAFSGGRVYLLYSAGNKDNCAVAMKTANVGKGTSAWVRLEKQTGGTAGYDSGTFKYYAGPVYVHAPGVCVRFSGGASGASASAGWGNCG